MLSPRDRLPRPSAWILKVVQAATAAACPSLIVEQKARFTEVRFLDQPQWTTSAVTSGFLAGMPGQERSPLPLPLGHLVRGLWSLAWWEGRLFRLSLPGRAGLDWDGRKLKALPAGRGSEIVLQVLSGPFPEPRSQCARFDLDVLAELRQHAYVAPLELRVDGRRLDSLLGPPSSLCVGLLLGSGSGPRLALPPGTFLGGQAFSVPPPAREIQIALRLETRVQGRWFAGLLRRSEPVHLNRIVDGVIAQRLPLGFAPAGLQAEIYLPAGDLQVDATGLRLQEEDREEVDRLCRLLTPDLAQAVLRCHPSWKHQGKRKGLEFTLASASLNALSLVVNPYLTVASVAATVLGGAFLHQELMDSGDTLLGQLRSELGNLNYAWRKRWPEARGSTQRGGKAASTANRTR